MTVSSQTSTATFVGNGVATAFPLPFRFFENGDIRAYFIDSVTGAATQMVLGSDYTLIGAGEPEVDGNALSLLTTTVPLASMRGLYVERVMPQVQETDIVNQGEFFASTHEDVFDRLTMLIQQSNSNSQGAIRVAIGDPEPDRLPNAIARANLLMGFDSIGNPITVSPVSGSASDLAMNLANDTDPTKGADLIGYAPGVTVRDALNKFIRFENFGAVGDGVTDDTAAVHAALSSGAKFIRATSGKTYNLTSVTLATNNAQIFLESGSVIAPQVPTAKAIIITGQNCSIVGAGTIKGVPTFDGANVKPTYALVWVEGNGFAAHGITIDTIPKEGIMFENSTGGRVENCRFIGRYPYASYNEATTTNHCGIMSNIPAIATNPEPTLTVVGNYFESCIQGVLSANYGDAGNNTGNTITGNTFKHCWDHGVYMSRGEGHVIAGNLFLSCRRPIVSDGIGSVVVGNALYSELTGVSNAQQIMSVRESSNSVIANNSIYGVDAAIYVDCIETVVSNGNIIQGNSIYSTGTVFTSTMIRVGVGTTTCEYNKVTGNTLMSASLGAADALIQVTMLSGFGRGNEVSGNTVVRTNPGNGININRNSFSVCRNNRVDISGNAGGATSITGIAVDKSAFPVIKDNDLYYTSGGTNVTAIGISTGAGCTVPKVHGNKINFTAAFASYTPVSFAVTTDSKRNLFDPNAAMTGTFTWTSGTASFAVANTNVRASSKIIVTPLNVGAAAVMRDKGFYIVTTLGGFSIFTAAGDTTASASNWDYEIL